MRSFACRRLGSLGFAFRSAPANTTMAQTPRLHHGGLRAHARLSFASAAAGDERARVSCRRRETKERGGLADENVRPRIKLSGVAARRMFAERGIHRKPLCVAAGVRWRKRAGGCEDQPAMSNARNDIALTHDNACSVIAPGACLDARATVAARASDRPSRREPLERIAWCKESRFEHREEPHPLAKRFGAAATGTGDEERAARQLAVAAANRPRNRKPPRRLKPLPTRLEAIDGRGPREENCCGRRDACVAATSSAQGRAFCRGIGIVVAG